MSSLSVFVFRIPRYIGYIGISVKVDVKDTEKVVWGVHSVAASYKSNTFSVFMLCKHVVWVTLVLVGQQNVNEADQEKASISCDITTEIWMKL